MEYLSPGKRAVLSCSVFNSNFGGSLLSGNKCEFDVDDNGILGWAEVTILPCNGATGLVIAVMCLLIGILGKIIGCFTFALVETEVMGTWCEIFVNGWSIIIGSGGDGGSSLI